MTECTAVFSRANGRRVEWVAIFMRGHHVQHAVLHDSDMYSSREDAIREAVALVPAADFSRVGVSPPPLGGVVSVLERVFLSLVLSVVLVTSPTMFLAGCCAYSVAARLRGA